MRTRFVWMLCIVIVLLTSGVANAGKPMTAAVSADPSPVKPGEPLALTSSVTNHSRERQVVSVQIDVSGPCGASSSHGYKAVLTARQTDTAKANYTAPACVGDYRATMSVINGEGKLVGTATTTFHVIRTLTASGSR